MDALAARAFISLSLGSLRRDVHFSFARPKEKRTKEKGRRLHLRG
jgi:hypothetical protein